MKFFSLFLLIASFSMTSFAGDKGNIYVVAWDGFYGGDAVVCRGKNAGIISAELLDYVERDLLNRPFEVLYEKELSDYQFVTRLATKLERVAPDVFLPFRREALKLVKHMIGGKPHPDVVFYNNHTLVNVEDTGIRRYPIATNKKGCKVEQLVIRFKRFNSITYYVQSDIFQKLSPRDKRGLLLHEAIYHSFNMFYGDEDSGRARFFNRSLMIRKSKEQTDKFILDVMKSSFVRF